MRPNTMNTLTNFDDPQNNYMISFTLRVMAGNKAFSASRLDPRNSTLFPGNLEKGLKALRW
jgi:hypothetical protein